MPDEETEVLETEYEAEEHTNGHRPNVLRIAEASERAWTEVHEDPAAMLREFLGPGEHFLDIFLRTRFKDEEELKAHVRIYARAWHRMQRQGELRGHPLAKLPLRVIVAQLKERGLISMFGDGRYEALQGLAGVVVAERGREGKYKRGEKTVGKQDGG